MLNFLSGELRAESLPLLPSRSERRTLLILSPARVPGLAVILTLSQDRDRVKWWLFCKQLLEGLNENERIVLTLLTVGRSAEEYRFFREILEFDFLDHQIGRRIALLEKVRGLVPFTRSNPTRWMQSWRPSLQFNRFWFDRKRLPPTRYIGVGYKDQGSLNSATLGVGESGSVDTSSRFEEALFSFRILFQLPLPVSDFPGKFSPLGRIRLKRSGRPKRDKPGSIFR